MTLEEQYILSIPSLSILLDASQPNGIGVTNPDNNSIISTFKNLQGNTVWDGVFDIVGGTAPTFKSSGGINNLPYLDFVTANNNSFRINTKIQNPYGANERTIISVFERTSGQFLVTHDFTGIVPGCFAIYSRSSLISFYDVGGYNVESNNPIRLPSVIFSHKNGGMFNYYRFDNSVNLAPFACSVYPSNASENAYCGITFGTRVNPSTNVPDTACCTGKMYLFMVFNKQLSLPEINQVQVYLKSKYNV